MASRASAFVAWLSDNLLLVGIVVLLLVLCAPPPFLIAHENATSLSSVRRCVAHSWSSGLRWQYR